MVEDKETRQAPDGVVMRPYLLRRALIPHLLIIGFMLIVSGLAWWRMPAEAQVPLHWNIQGEVDALGNKAAGLLIMPSIALGTAALFLMMALLEPRKHHMMQSRKVLGALWLCSSLMLAALHLAMVLSALGHPVDMVLIANLGLGLSLLVTGNLSGKIRSNHFLGVRTPWTLSSELSWNRTHRLCGRLLVASGLGIILLALFSRPMAVLAWLLFSMALLIVISLAYSYRVWKADPDRQAHPTR